MFLKGKRLAKKKVARGEQWIDIPEINKYFECAKEQVKFFHPNLIIIQLDLFKVIKDDPLIHEEDEIHLTTMIPTQEVEASFERNEDFPALDDGELMEKRIISLHLLFYSYFCYQILLFMDFL